MLIKNYYELKFCPTCTCNLGIFSLCEKVIEIGKHYTVINLDNVLEHVLNPLVLLKMCYSLLEDNGALVINVPNDFNPLQIYMAENNFIHNKKWITIPDHISYFNKVGLINICKKAGFTDRVILGNELIELFSLNPDTNYYDFPETGHNCHIGRMRMEYLLNHILIRKKVKLQIDLGDMGLGRNLIGVFVRNKL